MLRYQSRCRRVKTGIGKRLTNTNLKLNEEKTKHVPFSSREASNGDKQGAFDFLGFTLYLGCSKAGQIIPKVKTIGKRYRSKLKKVNDWCREMRNQYRLKEIWKRFCIKLAGHIQYYGVSFNTRRVSTFCSHSIRIFFKWINRRSQRQSFSWEQVQFVYEGVPASKGENMPKLVLRP